MPSGSLKREARIVPAFRIDVRLPAALPGLHGRLVADAADRNAALDQPSAGGDDVADHEARDGPARLPNLIEQVVGVTFELAATVCTVVAGPIGAIRYQSLAAAWCAGTYAGLVSGVFTFAFAVPMTLATLSILGSRSDYKAQFARSGAPTIACILGPGHPDRRRSPPHHQRGPGADRRRICHARARAGPLAGVQDTCRPIAIARRSAA